MPVARLIAAAAFALASTAVAANDIEGRWVSEGGHATFDLWLCGDGTELCVSLVSLSEDTIAPVLVPFVGRQMFAEVQQVGEGRWELSGIFGADIAEGSVALVAPDRIRAIGCLHEDCKRAHLDKVVDADDR